MMKDSVAESFHGEINIYDRREACDKIRNFGNSTIGVKVSVNHHITYIVESLNS